MLLSRVCFSFIVFVRVALAFAPPSLPKTKRAMFSARTKIKLATLVPDNDNGNIPKHDPVSDIRQLLQSVEYNGYHFTHGNIQNPRMNDLPIVDIENCGRLPHPVSPEKAKQLINKASPSPFGLGEKTIVDDKFRKSWQFEPQQVKINESWTKETLNKIVDQVKEGLGMSNHIKAIFHKLLIYEEGSFFKGHVDSQKMDGMFGTLSIQLPSLFEGGSFKFDHLSHSDDVDLSADSEKSLKWIAWYADTFHEIAPLKSGYRVALVYNLVRVGPVPSTVEGESSAVKKNEEEDQDDDEGFDYVKLLPELKEKIQEWQLTLSEEEQEEDVSDGVSSDDDDGEEDKKKELIKAANKNMIVYKLDHSYTLRSSLFDGCTKLEDYAYLRGKIGDFDDEISGNINADYRTHFGGIPRSEFAWIDGLNGRDRNVALLLCRAAAQNALNVSLVLQDVVACEDECDRDDEDFVTLKVLRDGTTKELPWIFAKSNYLDDDPWCIFDNCLKTLDLYDRCDWDGDNIVQSVYGETIFGNEGVGGYSRYRMGFLMIEPPTVIDAEKK